MAPESMEDDILRGLRGETVSFQIAYQCDHGGPGENSTSFFVEVMSPLRDQLQLRQVALVPCAFPCHDQWDEDYLATAPGLYPDLLLPLHQPVRAVVAQWRALWVDVKLTAATVPGDYPVTVYIKDCDHHLLQEWTVTVRVLEVVLPEQTLLHTEWFHADCLADYYHVPVFSEEHWRILKSFIASAADHGVTMLLTPLFTPPMDTAKGGERTTVQLLDAYQQGKGYRFDFARLERWILLCHQCGIDNLEMPPLFSQWGAEFAPKVMVINENGTVEKRFGWHTPATGDEYTRFLRALLPELKRFLIQQGMLDHTWFHISDEPSESQAESFGKAKASVADLLEGCQVMDALSSFSLYQQGLVERPVASVDHIQPFIDHKVAHLWAYYCTGQALKVPNRFIVMPSSRNRILGALLYFFDLEGFLHWGFNFYNSQYSRELINPYQVTDAGEAFPSGDPFLVYPGEGGSVNESVRGMVLKQALYDLRALRYLESKLGREKVLDLLLSLSGGELSFTHYPKDERFFTAIRKAVEALES
ncbi:MAG: DUF4091 domain-containing protein [Eubacteriales bacterium]|nr:DUF4091 domain-containing protein [Eubacteriales bacterium]